ncbi:MAG: hypothetical protein HC882_01860 [Acidobacteria bacterium]|nr:hypothetical protein [Acidobacteriota bacterium]
MAMMRKSDDSSMSFGKTKKQTARQRRQANIRTRMCRARHHDGGANADRLAALAEAKVVELMGPR